MQATIEQRSAAALRELREEGLGLTQEGFARELRCTFSTVNRWESGRILPSQVYLQVLDLVCKRLGVRLKYETHKSGRVIVGWEQRPR